MIYVFLASGFEEIEAIATIDILRRAELSVTTVGIGGKNIKGSHGIIVSADEADSSVLLSDTLEAVVLPGGMPGTLNLEKSSTVSEFIDFAMDNNKLVAAICAAPSILGHKGLLTGKNATCFHGYEDQLIGAIISDKSVVIDGNIITAKAAGVTIDFALAIVKVLKNKETAEKIRMSMQCSQ